MEFSAYINQKIRLDAYLCEILKTTRRIARKYCENNLVRVNKKIARAGIMINERDLVSISLELEPIVPGKISSELNIEIIFENEDFIILNKIVGIHCVKLENTEEETIADWLAAKYPETLNASKDIRESGLVNRLDYYTSGILIAAKSKKSWKELRSNKEMLKTYYALVMGKPQVQTIEFALENKSNTRVQVSDNGIRRKTEIVSVNKIIDGASLVKLQGNNFSRHQLRAHLSYIGSPLIGDEIYGGKNLNILKRKGFFLHSENLKFEYKNKFYNFFAKSEELKFFLSSPKS